MKVNRTRSIAKRNMRNNPGGKKNRPEQILAKQILEETWPEDYMVSVKTEHKPKNLKPLVDVDLTGERSPRLDIAIFYWKKGDATNEKQMAIRLQGPPHDEKKRDRYDFIQKGFLENQDPPWVVVDFVYTKMQYLFKRNTRKLNPGELKLAVNEVRKALIPFVTLKAPTETQLAKFN